jgi:hypothetical protein
MVYSYNGGESEVVNLVEGILANVSASGNRELDSWWYRGRDIHHLARNKHVPSWCRLSDDIGSDKAFREVRKLFRARFPVSLFAADLSARRKLNYLAGAIHLAKLRSTLLAEYGV